MNDRSGPRYPSRGRFLGAVLWHLATHPEYFLRRNRYPHFRLRALLAPARKGELYAWRMIRHGRYYYGASLRTPRWPSPAFDRMIANGGLNVAEDVVRHKHHIDTAILGITRRCTYACEHCYDAHNRAEHEDVPLETWIQVVAGLEHRGVSVIILSGGEPMLRYEHLLSLLDHSNPDLADHHLHTAGYGVTPGRAKELAARGLVAAGVGLDFPEADEQDRFRRQPGAFATAVRALEAFGSAGVLTYTNLCLTRRILETDGLPRYLELARNLGVGVVQLLEPKPTGRYGCRSAEELFSESDRQKVLAFFREANRSRRFRDHPPVAYNAHFERPESFGCLMGGVGHLSIDSRGHVNPCVFLPVSFGNVLEEDVDHILDRMQGANAGPWYRPCPAETLSPAIRAHRERTGSPVVPIRTFQREWDKELSGQC